MFTITILKKIYEQQKKFFYRCFLRTYSTCIVAARINDPVHVRKGTLNCKLYWFPKFFNQIILFLDLKALGTFFKCSLVDSELVVSTNNQDLFIVHCLIP